uniref:AnkA-1 n=1 Tax=Anaplasma marginale TaxID=770 RepID=F8U691_ANAMA|nr:AnkA-1 [Anaplasma marginale]
MSEESLMASPGSRSSGPKTSEHKEGELGSTDTAHKGLNNEASVPGAAVLESAVPTTPTPTPTPSPGVPPVPPLPPREEARRILTYAWGNMQRDEYAEFVAQLANVPNGYEDTWLLESDLKTILHHACSAGDPKYVSYLLDHGYSISAVDIQANTPLHDAATALDDQSAARLQLILEHLGYGHPTARAINLQGEAPLHSAIACENLENVKKFVELSDCSLLDLELRTFLHRAARNRGDEFTSHVLEHVKAQVAASKDIAKHYKALLCSEDLSGYLPAHYAATRGLQNSGIKILQETIAQARMSGEDIGVSNILQHMGGAGNTILNCATKGKCGPLLEEAVKIYAQHCQAGFSIQDEQGKAPIHNAAGYVSADLFAKILHNTNTQAFDKHTQDGANLLSLVMQDKADRTRRQGKIKLCLDVPEIAQWINTPGLDGMVPLCEMYLEGNSVEYITDLIKSDKVDVDSRCTDGRSVIHIAAERGDVKVLEALLLSRKNAKGDAKFPVSEGQCTPAVHVLQTRGDDDATLEVIKRLIPQEPSLEDVALHAARSGNYRVLQYVTDCTQGHGGIDVNRELRDAKGNVVSICGELLRNGHINIVSKLVKTQGARLEGIDSQCALSSAIQGDCFTNNRGNIAGYNWFERTCAQLMALFTGLTDMVRKIFNEGIAIERGIKLLLQNGAEIRGYEVEQTALGDDDTPLIFAIKHAQPNTILVRFLIRNGADVNCRDSSGNTALHAAVELLKFPEKQKCAQEFVDLLCARGASARQRNAQGHTPLHMAAAYRSIPAFESILRSNKLSALECSSVDGSSALHVAMKSGVGESDIMRMLKSCQQILAPVELAQMLSTHDSSGNTLMHVAAKLDFKDVVAFGLDNGAQMSIKNAEGKLAHELAPPSGHIAGGKLASKMATQVNSEGGARSYSTVTVDPLGRTSRARRNVRTPAPKAGSIAGRIPAAAAGGAANDDNKNRGTGPSGPGSTGSPSQGGSGVPGAYGPDAKAASAYGAHAQDIHQPSAPGLDTPGDAAVCSGGHGHPTTHPWNNATVPTAPHPDTSADSTTPPPYASIFGTSTTDTEDTAYTRPVTLYPKIGGSGSPTPAAAGTAAQDVQRALHTDAALDEREEQERGYDRTQYNIEEALESAIDALGVDDLSGLVGVFSSAAQQLEQCKDGKQQPLKAAVEVAGSETLADAAKRLLSALGSTTAASDQEKTGRAADQRAAEAAESGVASDAQQQAHGASSQSTGQKQQDGTTQEQGTAEMAAPATTEQVVIGGLSRLAAAAQSSLRAHSGTTAEGKQEQKTKATAASSALNATGTAAGKAKSGVASDAPQQAHGAASQSTGQKPKDAKLSTEVECAVKVLADSISQAENGMEAGSTSQQPASKQPPTPTRHLSRGW